METNSKSYVYFALKGDDFDPVVITDRLKIKPSKFWRKGDKGRYIEKQKFSNWQLNSEGIEKIEIDNLVNEIIIKLNKKIDIINGLKKELGLESVLEIVLYIDTNEEETTPSLGHDLKTIDFLYKTRTITDIDIYRFDSKNEE
jgi:hypothetical protein